MADSANEPASVEKKPLPRWRWWAYVAIIAICLVLLIPVAGGPSPKSITVRNLAQAKGIFATIKMYGSDNEGHYPRALLELEPDYLTSIENTRFLDDWDSHRHYDWFYIQGLSDTSPATWIVIASPTDQIFKNHERRSRIVVYNDGSAVIISAEKFNTQFAEQIKAMAAQAP